MNVLGIETSCDETAAAVVENGQRIRSNTLLSSLKEHQRFGGIIPEIASRKQLEFIQTVVHSALANANLTLNNIDALAVTQRPGLIGSLLVGIAFARSLAYALRKPLIEVDHIQAHLYANFLQKHQPKLPAVGLVASGGHTSLFYIKNFTAIKLIGETRDDALGETYDKVARILELGYPGGPVIDKLARKAKNSHIHFTCAAISDTLDFSFSGIKTAVYYYVRDHGKEKNFSKENIAQSFQKSVIEVVIEKCRRACQHYKAGTLLIGGGVAANSYLREKLTELSEKEKINIYYPPLNLCTDNAAMIAGWGYQLLKKQKRNIS